jgi:hypothetical protein
MAVYGPGCHPQNSIWTEANLRSKYYFVGDRPVHKLAFGPKEKSTDLSQVTDKQEYSKREVTIHLKREGTFHS